MGLAASQGRYLCLTARNSDLIYEGQQISQQRMALAKETQAVADKYNEAMSNTIMTCVVQGQESQLLTYDVLTNQDLTQGLGMRIVDANGNVVIPGEYMEVSQTTGEGEEAVTTTSRIVSSGEFVKKYMGNLLTPEQAIEWSNKPLIAVSADYNEMFGATTNISTSVVNKDHADFIEENDKVTTDPFVLDSDYLQEMLSTGQYFIQKEGPTKDVWENYVWQGSSMIAEEYDKTDDAVAEAEYETAMLELQKKDKLLELRLEQVQTQQQAVEKEMESVKDIIGKNIENGFKTFA